MALAQAPPLKTASGKQDEDCVEFSFASSRLGCAVSRDSSAR